MTKGNGWHGESRRHGLARKGVNTVIDGNNRLAVNNYVARGYLELNDFVGKFIGIYNADRSLKEIIEIESIREPYTDENLISNALIIKLVNGKTIYLHRDELNRNVIDNTYNYHYDAGHGWLAVPLSVLLKLKISNKISPHSYKKGEMRYLEEDVDAPLFIKAFENKGGKITINEISDGDESKIRSYKSMVRWIKWKL